MSSEVTIAQMRLLVAFESHSSLSEVARHLSLSQPTVSANLSKLERKLGMRLVERMPSGSHLTEQGRTVATWARGLIREADALDALLDGGGRRSPRPLRVAASMTIAEYLMPHWLLLAAADSGPARGEVELMVANSEHVMDMVESREVALGFIEGLSLRAGLRSASIGEDRLAVVVRPRHPWASRGVAISVDELLAADVVVREPGSGTREVVEKALARLQLSLPAHTATMGSTSTIKTAVRAADVAGIVSLLAVRDELADRSLVEITVDDLPMTRRLRAVWIGDVSRDARMGALIATARAASRHP